MTHNRYAKPNKNSDHANNNARASLRLENINMRSKLILNSAQKGRCPEQPHNGPCASVTGCPEHQYVKLVS